MFDMLKTILLYVLGLKAAPATASMPAGQVPAYHAAPTDLLAAEPAGYPVFDSTDMISVTEGHVGIL